MNKLLKSFAISFCLMILPCFSIAADTFTAPKDIWLQKGYQDPQVIYKILEGTVMSLKSTNGNWYNVSHKVNGEEITGWIALQQTQSSTSNSGSSSTPNGSTAPGGGLTLDQQAYLRDYTYTYVNKINSMGVYKYSTSHAVNDNAYNLAMTNGVMYHCCASFAASMLHQTVGAPFNGETVDGKTYQKTGYYGTGFANPNGRGKEVFFNIGGGGYLEPGDVITCAGYSTHAVLYLGFNEKSGYHEVAESGSKLRITKLVSGSVAPAGQLTLGHIRSRTAYGEASRLKSSVLPKNWTMPSSVVINIKNVTK